MGYNKGIRDGYTTNFYWNSLMSYNRLTTDEMRRYQRQIILPDFGKESQERLKRSRILVVGAGGLASPILKYLCGSGVGCLGLMDGDLVDISNLPRQVMYDQKDRGSYKVTVSASKLREQNPDIEIVEYNFRLCNENAEGLMGEYDVVIDACDNFETRYLISRVAQKVGKPWVYGSVFEYGGQVSVFNYRSGTQYDHLYSEPPDEIPLTDGESIGVLSVVPGVIGLMQATEAIKIITGVGTVLDGDLLLYNALDLNCVRLAISSGKQDKG